MLEIKGYDKEELMDIFHTERMDNVQRTLRRQGYEFYTNGKRGKNFRLYITKTGDEFKIFCIEELGISTHADFMKIKYLMFFYFCEEEFSTRSKSEMERFLAKWGITVSRQTISKWLKYLENKGILYNSGEFYYYTVQKVFPFGKKEYNYTSLTKEEYRTYWKIYWDVYEATKDIDWAFHTLLLNCDGTLLKTPKMELNGIYKELIDDMVDIILDDERFVG